MPAETAARMDYIQKVFLSVQDFMLSNPGLEELLVFLDKEPPEYRSVAYEAASMEVGLQDLKENSSLHEWKTLYFCANKSHTYHLEIGLGWAFAKMEIAPDPHVSFMNDTMRNMVFDGIGYYHGLYRGRRTVKNHVIPAQVTEADLFGFDQGLGRRLWYIARGEVDELLQLTDTFPEFRQPALWQGVGIACGYVGGTSEADLYRLLAAAGSCETCLCTGIEWAIMSRIASDSKTPDLDLACQIICKTPIDELISNASL